MFGNPTRPASPCGGRVASFPVIALSPIPEDVSWTDLKSALMRSVNRTKERAAVRLVAQKCPACRNRSAARAKAKADRAAGRAAEPIPKRGACTCGNVAFVSFLKSTVRHPGQMLEILGGVKAGGHVRCFVWRRTT